MMLAFPRSAIKICRRDVPRCDSNSKSANSCDQLHVFSKEDWNPFQIIQTDGEKRLQEVSTPRSSKMVAAVLWWWFCDFGMPYNWKYFIFHNIWDNPSNWLIFFKLVKTTNQLVFGRENGWKGIREQNHWWSTNLFPGRMAVKLCNVRVSIGLSSQVMLPLN